jgi:hypothetical protein
MASDLESHQSDQGSTIQPAAWRAALDHLKRLLQTSNGQVSSRLLRKELEQRDIENAREICVRLRFYNSESEDDAELPQPDFVWHHKGRSFYSEQAYEAATAQSEAAADINAQAASEAARAPNEEEEQPRRQNRQEEARLGSYVQEELESIYASEFVPDERRVSFDVHSTRAGSAYENVDVIAVHWRSENVVELVAVEVKLSFSAGAVQQANNYTRFAHRVWVAIPVKSGPEDAGLELREEDHRLFEYIIRLGIGILGCRRLRGRSYDVFPLHWPRLNLPDEIERTQFIERHRSVFEEAGIVQPRSRHFPTIR